jgi:uncharacterized membrane protein YhhN
MSGQLNLDAAAAEPCNQRGFEFLGHSAATPTRWEVAAGALLFAASDLAVARDRFVRPALRNKLWGLPAYFAAQLLLAASLR